jgi:hypothetical protein
MHLASMYRLQREWTSGSRLGPKTALHAGRQAWRLAERMVRLVWGPCARGARPSRNATSIVIYLAQDLQNRGVKASKQHLVRTAWNGFSGCCRRRRKADRKRERTWSGARLHTLIRCPDAILGGAVRREARRASHSDLKHNVARTRLMTIRICARPGLALSLIEANQQVHSTDASDVRMRGRIRW